VSEYISGRAALAPLFWLGMLLSAVGRGMPQPGMAGAIVLTFALLAAFVAGERSAKRPR